MQKVVKCVFLLFHVTLCVSCKRSMTAPAYAHYVTETKNGLVKTTVVDGFKYTIQYKPYDYIVLIESKGDVHRDFMENRKKNLEGTAWFNISLKRTDNGLSPLRYGISSLDEYNQRLNYFLEKAKNDIWMLYGLDTLHPMSYLFENNYNLTPQQTIIVGFFLPKEDKFPGRRIQLVYNDQIFKTGIIKATFTEESLSNVPNLDLN